MTHNRDATTFRFHLINFKFRFPFPIVRGFFTVQYLKNNGLIGFSRKRESKTRRLFLLLLLLFRKNLLPGIRMRSAYLHFFSAAVQSFLLQEKSVLPPYIFVTSGRFAVTD